jgi:hypothetical protein
MSGEPTCLMAADCDVAEVPVIAGAGRVPSTAPAEAKTKASGSALEAVKRMFSFPAMLGAFLVGWVFSATRIFFVDPDVWWHIRVGQDILRTHHWPTTDPYSFTVFGTPWIAYEWLGEVVVARVAWLGGNTAMFVLLFATASAAMLMLYYYGTLRSGNCKAGFVPAGVMWSLVLLSFNLRPQMFAYLFLVAVLIVLEKFRQGVSWPLWTLPMIFLLWVNTHGTFIAGIGVLVLYLCCGLRSFKLGNVEAVAWSAKQRMQLEMALLLSLAVLPITPYGTQLAAYPFDLMFNQPLVQSSIIEWQQMPFNEQFGKIFLGVVVLAVALQIVFRFTWRLEELLLAMGGAAMACLHARMLLLFVPFFVPILATMMARFLPPYQRAKEQYILNGAVMACLVGAMVHYFPSRDLLEKKVEASFPVQAVAYLDNHAVPGPMLNNYFFGGYLVGTGHKVFIDGRADIYERSGVLGDMLALTQMRTRPLAFLDRYKIESCLLVRDEPLAVVLAASPKWKQAYRDGTATIFVREKGAP